MAIASRQSLRRESGTGAMIFCWASQEDWCVGIVH